MKYRRFGRLDWEASVLGLGAARLPDAKQAAIKVVRAAIDRGVNYLDLGYPCDRKRHERIACVMGEALKGRYSGSARLALTLPAHGINSTADLEFELVRQLRLLRLERADFCLFGRLNRDNWPALKELGALKWAEGAVKDGRICWVGFSFHDHYQVLKGIVESWDQWALGQFQFSYMDINHDPGIAGIKYAAGRGLAAVVTEPLKMGRLPYQGLRYVWNHREISTAAVDFLSLSDLAECATLASRAEPDNLTVREELMIAKDRDACLALRPLACPSCRACMPCPEGIDVPRIFELYNDAFMYEDLAAARWVYINEGHRAGLCAECGACEKTCAKRLPVIEWLRKARRLFEDAEVPVYPRKKRPAADARRKSSG